MNLSKFHLIVGLMLMLVFVFPLSPPAQEITYTPSLAVSSEYNDNVLFERGEKLDDFIFSINPAIRFDYAADLFSLNSLASVNFRRYASETFLDREDQYYDLGGRYRLTERLFFNGRFYYLKDFSQESRVIDFEETAVDLEEGGEPGIERFLSERERYNGLAALKYQLTELSTLDARYRYLNTDYDFEGNTDYEMNNFELTFLRRLEGQRDRIGAAVSYNQRTSEISDADTYRFSLIWDHFFSEITNLYTKIGVRYTEQDYNDRNEVVTNWNGVADIRLERIGENSKTKVGFRQDLRTASDGNSVNVSRIYGESRIDLTERFFLNLEGDFYFTREEDDSVADDEESLYFDIISSLQYMLTEYHSVSLAYSYTTDYDRSFEDNRDKHRNRVWIVFEFVFPNQV